MREKNVDCTRRNMWIMNLPCLEGSVKGGGGGELGPPLGRFSGAGKNKDITGSCLYMNLTKNPPAKIKISQRYELD